MIDVYDVTCSKCTYGIFCDTWGEWKCTKSYKQISDPVMLDCKEFKKRTGPMPDCQCETCMARRKKENDN